MEFGEEHGTRGLTRDSRSDSTAARGLTGPSHAKPHFPFLRMGHQPYLRQVRGEARLRGFNEGSLSNLPGFLTELSIP